MAITIQKQKEKKAHVVEEQVEVTITPDAMSDEQLADHYGKLNDQCEAILTNPVFNNLDVAKKELLKRVTEQVEPQDGAEIQGKEWLLEIAACKANPRKITDVAKVATYMGTQFYKVAKVNLSDLDKYLTPDQVGEVTTNDTGYGNARAIVAKYLGPATKE